MGPKLSVVTDIDCPRTTTVKRRQRMGVSAHNLNRWQQIASRDSGIVTGTGIAPGAIATACLI
jgi:hypothetical protein